MDNDADVVARPLKAAAKRYGRSISTLYRLHQAGKIVIVKDGASSLVLEASMQDYIASLPRLQVKRHKREAA